MDVLISWGLLTGLLIYTGCAVGPRFQRPKPPAVKGYTHGNEPTQTAAADGQAQRYVPGEEIAGEWWQLYRCRALDTVVREAIDSNWNFRAAQQRLVQTRESLRAGYGPFFPQIDGTADASRQKFSPARFGSIFQSSIFNLYTASVAVNYLLDVFGGQRRFVEGLKAQVDYQKYTALATYLTLTGNVVTALIAQAAYRAEIEATEEIISLEKEQLRITEVQAQAGLISYSGVAGIKAQLAAQQATLPPLRQSLSATNHFLATLVGRTPAEWAPPTINLADLTLPQDLPVTLPSDLVRRRPDILAAEAQLHNASANIGVATAALFPSFTLTGTYGQNSTKLSSFFTGSGNYWDFGGGIATPAFQGGSLWFQRRAALSSYQASRSDYYQVVVTAFQQVADSLRALEHDAETLQAQKRALTAAEKSLRLIKANHRAGIVNYLQVLVADYQYNQAKLGYVQAQAQRLQDTAALFIALGGGWWNTNLPLNGN